MDQIERPYIISLIAEYREMNEMLNELEEAKKECDTPLEEQVIGYLHKKVSAYHDTIMDKLADLAIEDTKLKDGTFVIGLKIGAD